MILIMTFRQLLWIFCTLPILNILGCGAMSQQEKIQGSVTYLERIALPPNAQLEIVLADVSLADAPYQAIAEKKINPTGQVPIQFELNYDPKKIMNHHTYAVMARITDDGRLLFINDQSYQVITRGRPNTVVMVLKKVNAH
jgi:putative lipoprotein